MASVHDFDFFDFESGVAAGVPFHVKHRVPGSPGQVHIRSVFQVGARHDPPGKEGLCHGFEHIHYQGTESFPTRRHIQELNLRVFADSLNASTDTESTQYFGKCLREDLEAAVRGLREFSFCPLMRSGDIRQELDVIRNEIRREIPSGRHERIQRQCLRDFYRGHPFERMHNIWGWPSTVAQLTRRDMLRFLKTQFHVGNASLIFIGDITFGEARDLTALFAERSPVGVRNSNPAPITEWPEPHEQERVISTRKHYGTRGVDRVDITVSRVIPKQPDRTTIWLLRDLLRSLFDRVRGKLGSTYGVKVHMWTFRDHHLLQVETSVNPNKHTSSLKLMRSILAGLSKPGQYAQEFEQARQLRIRRTELLDYDLKDLSESAGDDLAELGEIVPVSASTQRVRETSYERIEALAQRELTPNLFHWQIVTP